MPLSSDSPRPAVRERETLPATRLQLASQALLDDRGLGWRVEVSRPTMMGLRSTQEYITGPATPARELQLL